MAKPHVEPLAGRTSNGESRRTVHVMKKRRRLTGTIILLALMLSVASAGCSPLGFFGPNFNLSIVVPLGLNGTPGVLNPFGIVQAVVNALIGSTATAGGATTAAGGSGTGGGGGIVVTVLG